MEGTLDRVAVAEVLQEMRARRRSGIVHVSREGTSKRLYFRDGAIVFASSDAPNERLGERLVRGGTLERSALELACRVTESSHLRLGATLVDLGYLTRGELDAQIKEQVTSIVHSVLLWRSGVYRTEWKDDPVETDLERGDLSTTNILLKGARGLEHYGDVRRGIGNLDDLLTYAADPASFGSELELTPAEGFVLSRVDGVTSPSEIAKLSPLGEEETLRCVYTLIAAGLLRVAPGSVPAAEPRSRPAEAESTPSAPTAGPSPAVLRFVSEMRARHARLGDATLYELLGVAPGASAESIKAAYFGLAKRLHPDHRAGLKIEDPDGVFDDLYLALKNAYDVLSSESKRRRYDFSREQLAEKLAHAQAMSSADSRASEAGAGPEGEPAPKQTFTASQSARIHFANGERYFAADRFHEAVEELRAAVRIEGTRPDYRRALGRALAKNPKWRKQAEEQLWKALEMDRFDAESYVELGELYAEGGLSTRARKMFEDALGLDPDNRRALAKLADPRERKTGLGRLRDILHRSREK